MRWIALAAVVVLGTIDAAMAVPALQHLRETPSRPPPETRTEIVTPTTEDPESFALSPDGQQIVFVASGDGESRLWLRSLATTTAAPLAGTEGARTPFWSPDGRSIAFFAAGALRRLDLDGGAPQTLATITGASGRGGSWNGDGVILFGLASNAYPLMRVPASGGAATNVTTLGPQQLGHAEPHFLPDGRRFLFYVWGVPDVAGIYLEALDETASRRLTAADGAGVFLPTGLGLAGASREAGWLPRTQAGTLVAQRVDVKQAALVGDPVTVTEGITAGPTDALRTVVSVSATGLIAYRTRGRSLRQLTWMDRSGTAQGTMARAMAAFAIREDPHQLVGRWAFPALSLLRCPNERPPLGRADGW